MAATRACRVECSPLCIFIGPERSLLRLREYSDIEDNEVTRVVNRNKYDASNMKSCLQVYTVHAYSAYLTVYRFCRSHFRFKRRDTLFNFYIFSLFFGHSASHRFCM